MQITVTVNGDEVTRDVEPRLLLVHFLRDELGLTGTHWGCDTSNCGACVVLAGRRAGEVLHRARGHGRRPRGRAPSRAWSATAALDPVQQGFMEATACSAGSAPRA